MKIDDKTWVPLSWMVTWILVTSSCISIGAFWVKGVNDRLERIEGKLDIKNANAPCLDTEEDATAYALNIRTGV